MDRKSFVTANLALLIWAAAAALPAQEKADAEIAALDGRVAQFLEGVSSGNVQSAYQQFLAGSPLAAEKDAINALAAKTSELKDKYGEYRSFEKIGAKRIGVDLVLLRYLYKCERFPVVWYFTFYRTPQRGTIASTDTRDWRAIIVRFDTDLEALAK